MPKAADDLRRAYQLQVRWRASRVTILWWTGLLYTSVPLALDQPGWLEITRTTGRLETAGEVLPIAVPADNSAARVISPSPAKLPKVNALQSEKPNTGGSRELPPVISSEDVMPMTRRVDMFVGEVQVLGQVEVTRVAVGSGTVVKVDVLEQGDLLVIAQTVGSSSVRLWHQDGSQSDFNIRVVAEDPEPRYRAQQMITLRVKMVEFRKNALRKLGIDWGDSIEGPTLAAVGDAVGNTIFRPQSSVSGLDDALLPTSVRPFVSYAGLATSLTSRINLMAAAGDALLLAEPVLSCASGESASFLAGGEVPYSATDANGQSSVEFKEYGIMLDIDPRIDVDGRVQASIKTEISSIDPAVAVQGAPGLLTRRAQTQVTVGDRQTIVIAGLLQEQKGTDSNELPGLGKVPLIGNLFRSRQTRNTVSELVIFITPEIARTTDEVSARHAELLQKTRARLTNLRPSQTLDLLD